MRSDQYRLMAFMDEPYTRFEIWRRARTALRPPKARELERAICWGDWRGMLRMTSRLRVGSTSVIPVLAGSCCWWRARMVARVSMAPVAPMEWPWRDLVELMGMWGARGPKSWWMAAASVVSLAWVPVPWALM